MREQFVKEGDKIKLNVEGLKCDEIHTVHSTDAGSFLVSRKWHDGGHSWKRVGYHQDFEIVDAAA